MAAGQGFKTFTTGEVLTAGDVNGYLMQGINVFADATARDAAITAPAEGQFAFTKDNNSLWYYTGSAWAASGATGDIEGVTAGVGISGGGTSGTVTVTNSMATAIDAKGDLVPGTGADTFARLAVGANDTVLTADSSTATGLKWAAAGSTTSVQQITDVNTLSGTTISITGLSSYDFIQFRFSAVAWNTGASWLNFTINNDTTTKYQMQKSVFVRNTSVVLPVFLFVASDPAIQLTNTTIPMTNGSSGTYGGMITLQNCKATGFTTFTVNYNWGDSLGTEETTIIQGIYKSAAAVSSFEMKVNAGYTFSSGGYTVYAG